MTKNTMAALGRKLREPSTWAGIAILGTMFGVPSATIGAVSQIGISLAGILAILLKEGGQ